MIKWPELASFEYPGRFIIIGRTETSWYSMYGVTARSAPSRAKKYVFDKQARVIKVEPTDSDTMARGNLELLSYNAVHFYKNGLVLGNGRQTDKVQLNYKSAAMSLAAGLQSEEYETDKYKTPRLTGALASNNGIISAALYKITAGQNDEPVHEVFDLALQPRQAYFLSTYSGEDIKPTPSYNGNPILLSISFTNAELAAKQVYEQFSPKKGEKDLRLSLISIQSVLDLTDNEVCIINSHK